MAEAQSLVRGGGRAGLAGAGAALAVALTACAPTVQQALVAPSMEAPAPRFEPGRFVSFDGAALGLTVWAPPSGEEPWAVVVGLHGMNDYAETFAAAGPYWAQRGVITYAYDARGHGRSPDRGVWGGEALLTQDLRAAIAAARARHPNAVLAVVGESMGGATAMATFAQADPPAVDRVVLSAPAVRGWSSMPRLYAFTLWLGAHTVPARRLTPPDAVVERITPSDNIEMLRAIGMDPLMVFDTRIDAVYGLVSLMQSASESAEAAPENTLVLYGAHDDIIPPEAMDGAAARLPETVRTAYYADGYHMLLRDLQRERVFDDVLAFLRDPDAPLPSGAPPIQSPTLR